MNGAPQALEPHDVDKPSDPDRVLWLAVINQALDDYESHVNGRRSGQYEAESYKRGYHWIETAGAWFRQVCSMAELDPESVQAAARDRARPEPRLARTR